MDARRIAELEREVRELRRANEMLKVRSTGELGFERGLSGIGVGVVGNGEVRKDGALPDAAGWTRPRSLEIPGAPRRDVEFRVLGPIEATVAGRPVSLGAPKQRALLALLVSRVGQPVGIDVIVEELWTGRPPPSAITSLQAYIANLRRALEPGRAPRTPATVLRTSGRGYLLDSVNVDADRFAEHAAAGWRALGNGDPHQALSEFEAALALWRGQPYADVADAPCMVPEVVRLEELRLSVIEGRCAALLGVGAHEVAVAELEAFTQTHPFREYAYELLSRALYWTGRQADALAVLRANQERLAEELGIDPGPALQRLRHEILNQDPALDWQPPQTWPASAGYARKRLPCWPTRPCWQARPDSRSR